MEKDVNTKDPLALALISAFSSNSIVNLALSGDEIWTHDRSNLLRRKGYVVFIEGVLREIN